MAGTSPAAPHMARRPCFEYMQSSSCLLVVFCVCGPDGLWIVGANSKTNDKSSKRSRNEDQREEFRKRLIRMTAGPGRFRFPADRSPSVTGHCHCQRKNVIYLYRFSTFRYLSGKNETCGPLLIVCVGVRTGFLRPHP